MTERKKYRIEQLAEKVGIGPFGSSIKVETFVDSGIPVISGGHLKGFRLEDGVYNFITEEHANKLINANVKRGDVIFTHAGNIGSVAYIPKNSKYERYILSQRQFYLRCNTNLLLPEYITYYFKTAFGQKQLLANSSSVGVPSIAQPVTYLKSIEIEIPEIKEQHDVINILSSLDDKIELNQQMNQTLEAMAQAIFKEWFVNFNFPDFDGELVDGLPKGWRMGKLGECITIKRGGSPRPIQEFIAETGLRWLKISDVTSLQTPYILETKEYIKEEGLSKTTLLKAGRLVLSNSATPGIPKILNIDSCIHDGWLHFPESMFSNEFLYLKFLELRRELVQKANGSIFTNLKTEIVRDFDIIIPDNNILIAFDNLIKPIFEKLLQNTLQIKALTQTRDTLLPKLMSGQIEIAI